MRISIIQCAMLICFAFGFRMVQVSCASPQKQQRQCCQPVKKGALGGVLRNNLLWKYGSEIIVVIVATAAVGLLVQSKSILGIAAAALLFSLYFFRNPERHCPAAAHAPVVVCPADGKVVDIVDLSHDFVGTDAQRISIFLSPLDVHVQWAPITGKVAQIVYHPGEFLVAYAPKSSEVNERNDLYLVMPGEGREPGAPQEIRVVVRQIAGFVARRICCWVEEGQLLTQGAKYGMIRFGSRVDIIMPKSVQLQVAIGDRVIGGQTVLGSW